MCNGNIETCRDNDEQLDTNRWLESIRIILPACGHHHGLSRRGRRWELSLFYHWFSSAQSLFSFGKNCFCRIMKDSYRGYVQPTSTRSVRYWGSSCRVSAQAHSGAEGRPVKRYANCQHCRDPHFPSSSRRPSSCFCLWLAQGGKRVFSMVLMSGTTMLKTALACFEHNFQCKIA